MAARRRGGTASTINPYLIPLWLITGSIIVLSFRFHQTVLVNSNLSENTDQKEQVEVIIRQRAAQERQRLEEHLIKYENNEKILRSKIQELEKALQEERNRATTVVPETRDRFPKTVKKYAVGLARVNKERFTDTFELGVPIDKTDKGSEEVLLLYKRPKTLPDRMANLTTNQGDIPILTPREATVNCDFMHVILTDSESLWKKQCLAIVPQYQSFHIQNWMRADGNGGKVNSSQELRLLGRGYGENGYQQFKTPKWEHHSRPHFKMLQTYLASLDNVLLELEPLARRVAKNNTVIVMVCNTGQSELLMNFACAAKSRGLSLDQALVFATDEQTKILAESLGMTAYFDKNNFGHLPSEAAGQYGDFRFTMMMMAKVICVQLINRLGYDVLFQDVDVVWFKNPIEFFHNESAVSPSFDVISQDDGSHSVRFAPYAANSGFYYVRNNERTKHFMRSLLLTGDFVLSTRSHQAAMIAALAEHNSLHGLQVKVINRESDELPGGWNFHNQGNWMRSFFAGEKDPFIFHMSWTENKKNKLLFFRQMGEWYVHDSCLPGTNKTNSANRTGETCCSAQPLVSCHYRDKPSKIPCHESPNIDKGKRPSFWAKKA